MRRTKRYFTKLRKLITVLFLLVVVIGIGYFAALKSNFFKIDEIEILGLAEHESVTVNQKVGEILKGQSIFLVSRDYVSKRLSESLPWVKLENVKYTLPGKLSLNLEGRPIVYRVKSQDKIYKLDKDAYVVESSKVSETSSESDTIQYDKELTVGQTISDHVLKAALLYSTLKQNITVQNNEITIQMKEGGKIILPLNKAVSEVTETVELLQKVLQKYTIEGKAIELIDLRFSKPVVKYH